MKNIHIIPIISTLIILTIMGCRKHNEEEDCYYQPAWRTCDSYDIPPTEYLLTSTIVSTDLYPIQLDIYTRTLVFGKGSLYDTFYQDSSWQTYILPEGRYTAEIQFSNDSIVEEEFRVYSGIHEYCEGTCYTINNDEINMQDPG
ncbi:MAG: hypothetical protein HOH13_11450 [Crocinitomicaceae bacterium]|jgi:hypothetical protein|nr:hypothetical protein [Crocinitomicaceae bacterium]MBT6030914.1 hypothetical protein [Crocinitomicaceae bacterium]